MSLCMRADSDTSINLVLATRTLNRFGYIRTSTHFVTHSPEIQNKSRTNPPTRRTTITWNKLRQLNISYLSTSHVPPPTRHTASPATPPRRAPAVPDDGVRDGNVLGWRRVTVFIAVTVLSSRSAACFDLDLDRDLD